MTNEVLSYTPDELVRYMNEHHNYRLVLPKNIGYAKKKLDDPLVCESEWITHDGRHSITLIQCTRLLTDLLEEVKLRSASHYLVGDITIHKQQVEFPTKKWKNVKTCVSIEYKKSELG